MMKKKTRPVSILNFGFLILFVLIAGWLAGCQMGSGESPTPTPIPRAESILQSAPGSITANGVLSPIRRMELSFGIGGFTETVFIKVGERVEAGQVLAQLDKTSARLALQQAEAELSAAQANYTLVVAGNPAEQQAAIADARLELISAQQNMDAIYKNAELNAALALMEVSNAQEAALDSQRYVNGLVAAAEQNNIDVAHAKMILAKADLERAQEAYDPWENKPEDNLTRATLLSRLAQAQQIYDAAVRQYNNLLGTVSEIDLAKAEANLAVDQARLAKNQKTYAILSAGPDPDEIAAAEARISHAQANLTLASAENPSPEQLAIAQAQVDSARSNLEIQQVQMENMVITAPFAGVVSAVHTREGEWAAPGETVIELLDISRWCVETKNVGELQIGHVEVGQDVQVWVNAFRNELLMGSVVSISPVAVVQQGDTTFTLVIELEPTNLDLWPGMTARVEIGLMR